MKHKRFTFHFCLLSCQDCSIRKEACLITLNWNRPKLCYLMMYISISPRTWSSAAVRPHSSPQSNIQRRKTANYYRLPPSPPSAAPFKDVIQPMPVVWHNGLDQKVCVEFSQGELWSDRHSVQSDKNQEQRHCLGHVWVVSVYVGQVCVCVCVRMVVHPCMHFHSLNHLMLTLST